MTLVLTEVSSYGIVMAADTAITIPTQLPSGQRTYRVLNGVTKLLPIPYLKAGISCWGYGEIANLYTDVWLNDFIARQQTNTSSLQSIAQILCQELRQIIGQRSGKAECGFHLAGFVKEGGAVVADFWHIHNGPSDYFSTIDPRVFNANHDLAVAEQKGLVGVDFPDQIYITRNGDYEFYARWWGTLERTLDTFLRSQKVEVPRPSLQGRVDYLRFQIRCVSEIYRMSTLLPSIGGEIITLAIDKNGIISYDRKA